MNESNLMLRHVFPKVLCSSGSLCDKGLSFGCSLTGRCVVVLFYRAAFQTVPLPLPDGSTESLDSVHERLTAE